MLRRRTEVVLLQVKEHQRLPEPGRGKEDLQGLSEPWFLASGPWDHDSLPLCSFWGTLHGSSRDLLQLCPC